MVNPRGDRNPDPGDNLNLTHAEQQQQSTGTQGVQQGLQCAQYPPVHCAEQGYPQ